MKRIILCADDYGQNSAISQAIINLLEKNRLTATSCMTNAYYWTSHGKWLQSFVGQAEIGLHFNLTEGKPLSKEFAHTIPLSQLIMKAYLRQLDQSAIEAELYAQIERFVSVLGREPDFIDGHQHIHQLPIVRDALLKIYQQRLQNTKCYIRCVNDPSAFWNFNTGAYFKTLIIQLCGSFTFKKLLIKNNIPHNSSFSGIYDFAKAVKYPQIFPRFLKKIKEGGIIMCHPGLHETENGDEITKSRVYEYQYFLSEKFLQDCLDQQITLGKLK